MKQYLKEKFFSFILKHIDVRNERYFINSGSTPIAKIELFKWKFKKDKWNDITIKIKYLNNEYFLEEACLNSDKKTTILTKGY